VVGEKWDLEFLVNVDVGKWIVRTVQGSSIFFFPQAKKSFPVGPSGQETPPGTIFEM
jgi:hypothetical protein